MFVLIGDRGHLRAIVPALVLSAEILIPRVRGGQFPESAQMLRVAGGRVGAVEGALSAFGLADAVPTQLRVGPNFLRILRTTKS